MISLLQLGTVDYATGLRLQQKLVALRKEEKIGDVLLLLEHKPVITLGRNAKAANVVASPALLEKRGVELFECDRGGDVTFHGPGQIVGYPIFDLRGYATNLSSRTNRSDSDGESRDLGVTPRKHLGAVEFVRRLEEVLIRTCADFSIPTKRVPGLTGVWTDPGTTTTPLGTPGRSVERSSTAAVEIGPTASHEQDREGHDFSRAEKPSERKAASVAEAQQAESKLAAIGVHISRSVTSHGFALNVNPDLSYFNLIIPCGITSKRVTSMQKERGCELDLNAVAESISRNFGVIFQSQILWVDTLDAFLGHTVGVPMKPPPELRQIHKDDESTWA